jgi:hypothetical protein
MIYKSDRKFRIWVYTVSHSSLILRSSMTNEDQDDYSEHTSYNIDLEFWAVSFINIPTTIPNLEISLVAQSVLPDYIAQNYCDHKDKVFEIKADGQSFYIVAAGVLIGRNRWGHKDRIFEFSEGLKHDEIIARISGA